MMAIFYPTQPREKCNMMFPELDHFLSKEVQENLCGMSLLIAQDEQPLFEKTYGFAQKYKLDIDAHSKARSYLEQTTLGMKELSSPIALSSNHLFDLASVTKVLASTFAIMLLADQYQLDLDNPIKKYLPAFLQSDKKNITIRQLLSHSSGLPAWNPLYFHANDLESAIAYIVKIPLTYQADSQRIYSDLGFMVLHHLIEKLSEQSLNQFLDDHLYKKLGLKNTLFKPKDKLVVATSHGNPFEYKMIQDDNFGYVCEEKAENFPHWRNYTLIGEPNDGNAHHVFSGISGHAGLFSTAAEVSKLLQFMLNQGSYLGTQLIQAKTVQSFITKTKHQHGLGWAMSSNDNIGDLPLGGLKDHSLLENAYGHQGFTGNLVLAVPSKKMSIVVLSNRQNIGINSEGRYYNMQNLFNTIVKYAVN